MATLILSVVGTAVGAFVGGPVGAAVGGSIGSFVGGLIDNAILGVGDKKTARAFETTVLNQNLTSTYGTPIPIGYGTIRVGGNVIWASDVEVKTTTRTQKVKTGKFSSKEQVVSQDTAYNIDLAIAFLQVDSTNVEVLTSTDSGDDDSITTTNRKALTGLRRIWMNSELVYDGRTFNTIAQVKGFDYDALYDGAESQLPDTHIESVEGTNNVPAFRGLAYILIKKLNLASYGQRVPIVNFEAVASLPRAFLEQGCEGLCEGLDGNIYVLSNLQRTVERVDSSSLLQVSRIGASPGNYLGTLKARPWRIATSPTDGRLWVTCKGDSAVQVVNPSTDAISQTVSVKHYPHDIMVDASGTVWVTFPYSNEICKIDPSTYATTYYTISGGPLALCKDTSGGLYVSCIDSVKKFDSFGSVLWTAQIGMFPWGMSYNHVTNELWCVCSGENQFIIITTTGLYVDRKNIGSYPIQSSIHPLDTYGSVAVTTYFGNQLKVYSKLRNEMLAYGTVSFPGQCLHLQNGRIFVAQTKYNFTLVADGR